jgi:SAM-dependent methyltransferase
VTHRRRQNFYALPTAQWQMLAEPPFDFLAMLDRVDDAIDENADLASEILQSGLFSFGLEWESVNPAMDWRGAATPADMDKARTTIRQLYRDWSAESLVERSTCYDPVIQDLTQIFDGHPNKARIKILVPGAGLGRLVFELCRRGYTVEGNEISYHQLIASNWVLNYSKHAEQFSLYPFVMDFSNVVNRGDQMKMVKIPDIHPGTELETANDNTETHTCGQMDMTAADFVILYSDEKHKNIFDAVTTVFFIDTAPNILRYIEVIRHCLKGGGTWINLGPLLWHFGERGPPKKDEVGKEMRTRQVNGIAEPGSIELTAEEMKLLIERSGFVFEKYEIEKAKSGYIHNPESMLQSIYRPVHWIAKKN